jgi:hypothetical protein
VDGLIEIQFAVAFIGCDHEVEFVGVNQFFNVSRLESSAPVGLPGEQRKRIWQRCQMSSADRVEIWIEAMFL